MLALGREVAGETPELEDVVVDRRRGDERAEPVLPRDQVIALEQLERLPQGHERNAEAPRELSLIVESGARRELAATDPFAQRLRDAVVARNASAELAVHPDAVHRTSVF